MNKQQKLDVMVMRAKMRAEQTLAKFRKEWQGQEPQIVGGEPSIDETPAPQIEEVE